MFIKKVPLKIAITDACVLVEFCELSIAGLYFRLGHETHTSVDIYNELSEAEQSVIAPFCSPVVLSVHPVSPADRLSIYTKGYPNTLTSMDKTGLYIASKVGATILTTERIIVDYAVNNYLPCEHFGWVFDQLVAYTLLTPSQAADKLSMLVQKAGRHQARTSFMATFEQKIKGWR